MKDFISKIMENFKKDKKHSMLVLVLVGVLILVIAWPVSDNKNTKTDTTSGADTVKQTQGSVNTVQAADGYGLVQNQTLEDYVAAQEARLKLLLAQIKGAGSVEVMITAHATREKVIEKDQVKSNSSVEETDSNGGTRVTTESSYSESSLYAGENGSSGSASSNGMPYVVKELTPEIEGVVVAAQGADDIFVIDEITQSVSVLFNLPVHKIKVVKMES